MGLLDKVKNILFDEEEIEIPEIKAEPKKELKKEPRREIKKEEENPIKEIKIPKDDFSDREYKSETTFTFPIDFEDEEIVSVKKEIEKPKVREVREQPKRNEKRDYSDFLTRKEDKKHFKPTPIISPVYGVLDQNYKKEDVILKKDILRKPNELTIEEVRKRAFGSLEDEIDANLTNTKEIKVTEELKIKKEKKIEPKETIVVEEPVDKKKTIGELIEEDNKNIIIPDIDGIEKDEKEYNNDVVTEDKLDIPTNTIDDLLSREEDTKEEKKDNVDEIDDEEADLFSLIDSMYEEKGE